MAKQNRIRVYLYSVIGLEGFIEKNIGLAPGKFQIWSWIREGCIKFKIMTIWQNTV